MFLELLVQSEKCFRVLVDWLCCSFDHVGLKTQVCRVAGRFCDAVVERKAANEHMPDSALLEEMGKVGLRDGRVDERGAEARVGFNAAVLAFVDDVIEVGGVQLAGESTAVGSLDAVIRPKRDGVLFSVGWIGSVGVDDRGCRNEWLGTRVLTRKRAVVGRVMVFRSDFEPERLMQEPVDEGDDRAAVGDSERARGSGGVDLSSVSRHSQGRRRRDIPVDRSPLERRRR